MNSISTGQEGQKIAEDYLKKTGYKIIVTNFRTRLGEIDIIAEEKGQFVFIEVKYRKGPNFGLGFEAVNKKKLAKINLVAEQYLKNNKTTKNCRIDVVSIDGVNIQHFKNV